MNSKRILSNNQRSKDHSNHKNNIISKPISNFLSFSSHHSNDCYNLCKKLFIINPNIDTILYYRIYKNGDYFHVSNNDRVNQFMFEKYKARFIFDFRILNALFANSNNPLQKNKICLFTEDINGNNFWSPMHKELNIKNSFNIIEKFKEYYDGLWIVSCQGKSMYSFYISNYCLLEKFLLHFRETGDDLIREGEKNKVFLVNNNPGYLEILNSLNDKASKNNYSTILT